MTDNPIDEDDLRTAAGLSARNLKGTQLSELAIGGWFTAFTTQIARHTGPLQILLDIANDVQQGREELATVPHPPNRFKQIFSRMGRAMTDDTERITRDAVAGSFIATLYGQLAHYAYNIGLKPSNLDYGPITNGHSYTKILWASRGAQFHAIGWMFRDFSANVEGRDEIKILRAVGIEAIPFSPYRALQFFAPDGSATSATLPMLEIGRAMMLDALASTAPEQPVQRKTAARKKSKRKVSARKSNASARG